MNINNYLRHMVRDYGNTITISLSSMLVILMVAVFSGLIDLLAHQKIHITTLLFSLVISLIVAPVTLYCFVSLIAELDRSEQSLRALSIKDDLTGVYNRRYFLERATAELAKAERYGNVFSIMAIDIDYFKKINDRYGHFGGDEVLKSMARICMTNLRTMDVFARFGGEEFMFLIPESDKTDVAAFAERILSAVQQSAVIYAGQEISFTVSIGAVTLQEPEESIESLLKAADDALYAAKRRGRNCIVIYDEFEAS